MLTKYELSSSFNETKYFMEQVLEWKNIHLCNRQYVDKVLIVKDIQCNQVIDGTSLRMVKYTLVQSANTKGEIPC